MTLPLNPAAPQPSNAESHAGPKPQPQAPRWQQEFARAQGQTTQAQSRNTLPAFDRLAAPGGASPTLLRLPPQPLVAPAGQAASGAAAPLQAGGVRVFAQAIDAHARSAVSASTVLAAGFLRAWVSKSQADAAGEPGLAVDGEPDPSGTHQPLPQAEPPPDLAEALCQALLQQVGAGQGPLGVRTSLTPEGVEVMLHASGPLAQDIAGLQHATLAFFARHGLHVARLECNGQLIFKAARGTDRIESLSANSAKD